MIFWIAARAISSSRLESDIGALSDLWEETIVKYIKCFRYIIYYKKQRSKL